MEHSEYADRALICFPIVAVMSDTNLEIVVRSGSDSFNVCASCWFDIEEVSGACCFADELEFRALSEADIGIGFDPAGGRGGGGFDGVVLRRRDAKGSLNDEEAGEGCGGSCFGGTRGGA